MLDITFWNILISKQSFHSPEVKSSLISSLANIVYELPQTFLQLDPKIQGALSLWVDLG